MASSLPHVSSADQAGISSSLFYGLPRTRRKRFFGNDNLLRHIDCNQSDISDESSDDEVGAAAVDRSSEEESSSTESEDEESQGLCYDFDVYPASSKGFYGDQGGYELGLGAGVVIQLCSSILTGENNLIIGDNFFQVLTCFLLVFAEDAVSAPAEMDVDSPGPPPTPSTSSAPGARKRSGEPNDADSEDTIIYSSASEESSYDSDFVPVTRRKAKRRLLMASSSSKTLEPPVHTICCAADFY
ncbi:hypothetical protein HPB50_029045 [Hyalomma asiaticum]|nr:hypothetical protein HPB50_029045 [Hyalomma asiaticum]